MRIHIIAEVYREKTDDELLELAAHPEQLTAEALSAISAELTARQLNAPTPANIELEQQQPRRDPPLDPNLHSRPIELRGFVSDVFRL